MPKSPLSALDRKFLSECIDISAREQQLGTPHTPTNSAL